jgi:cell pole-organizing protein PopZ
MDEILASIRRIISEDEATVTPVPPGTPGLTWHGDDVLLLTRRAPPEPSPFEDAPVDPPVAPPVAETFPAAETFPVAESIAAVEPAPVGEPDAAPPPTPAPEPISVAEPAPVAPPAAAQVLAASAPEHDGVVDREVALSAAAAFQELSFVIENAPAPPPIAISAGGPTLEEITRDLLRPMLKAWLDENLPGIVRARVDEEIERIARGRPR